MDEHLIPVLHPLKSLRQSGTVLQQGVSRLNVSFYHSNKSLFFDTVQEQTSPEQSQDQSGISSCTKQIGHR